MDTLKKHFPYSGPEGINELKRIAARFEEKIFSSAVNQVTHTSFFFVQGYTHLVSSFILIFVSLVWFYIRDLQKPMDMGK